MDVLTNQKIITKEEFANYREQFRQRAQRVVLCHGVYDLLHYGHIEHLQEAKAQGDILVVSVTAGKFVNKGPGRPYFSDQQRMAFLASLEFVDYVLLSEAVTVHDIVSCVQPDVYVKGQEYAVAENDITGNIGGEQAIVEQYGGKIYFTEGIVFSSTKLLNNFFNALPEGMEQVSHQLKEKYSCALMEHLREQIESFHDLKVLVVGDVIIDEYIFCKLQGLTAKDSVISTRYDFEERYTGGSLAIAKHLANFCDHVSLCAITGTEPELAKYIEDSMQNVKLHLLKEENFITPVKRRFLKLHPQRQEYDKLFSMNKLLDCQSVQNINYAGFYAQLRKIIPQYDVVVVCDYGHGLLDDTSIRLIEGKANFLAVNCQTNSSNFGMNLITKYKRADTFVVDERELHLALQDKMIPREELLHKLLQHFSSAYGGWLTIGAEGAIGEKMGEQVRVPAATLHVKDTVGAGDAFYALAVLCAARNMPVDLATLISNTSGAIKTNLVGNSKAVEKVEMLKFLSTILNV